MFAPGSFPDLSIFQPHHMLQVISFNLPYELDVYDIRSPELIFASFLLRFVDEYFLDVILSAFKTGGIHGIQLTAGSLARWRGCRHRDCNLFVNLSSILSSNINC